MKKTFKVLFLFPVFFIGIVLIFKTPLVNAQTETDEDVCTITICEHPSTTTCVYNVGCNGRKNLVRIPQRSNTPPEPDQ